MENMDSTAAAGGLAMMGMFFTFFLIIFAAFYIYAAVCLLKIAKKLNTPDAYLAWIPIANIYLMTQMAKKPWWWVLLCFVPIVNIVALVILFVEISKLRGKPEWLGILMIVPGVNLIVLGYLAFAD